MGLWVLSNPKNRAITFLGADFWAGDPTKHLSVKKKGVFSEKGGGIQ